ncbi:class I SAM-dependent methyltransferase [Niallia sp. 01092]|uniref:class I SAM-dependent methyltransferase n=1 Tax=unclassified Niallia TaxID=2837522 RepID=UPI003FD680C2
MGEIKSNQDNWNANLYDSNHRFVSKYGNDVVELLAPKKGERILDLGCGTGDLAKKLADFDVDIVGVDKSESMISQAISKYPTIPFFVQDATELEYDHEFDAVFSNAALHWMKKPQEVLACIYKSLKKGGRFVAEFGGKGNVQSITDGTMQSMKKAGLQLTPDQFPWYFPSIGEYTTLMEKEGFRVTYAHHFDRPTKLDGEDGLKTWIRMFGHDFFSGVEEDLQQRIIATTVHDLKDTLYKDGNWIADYKRIRVIGVKE